MNASTKSESTVYPLKTGGQTAGVDIGGANIKWYLSGSPTTDTIPAIAAETSFAMWRHPERLANQLANDWQSFERHDIETLAVTMTGELADCFADRREGVDHIATHAVQAAKRCGIGRVVFYSTSGRLLNARQASRDIQGVAAANWHALASAVGQWIVSDAILIDIGSTTTDVISIADGRIITASRTDHQRLADRSLLYLGCRRTPICSLVDEINWRGKKVPLMREVFATIDDARLIAGFQPAVANDCETADGRPRDLPSASRRLARMIGLDIDECSPAELSDFAAQILAAAGQHLHLALRVTRQRLADHGVADPTFVLSGHGQELLPRSETDRSGHTLDLRQVLGAEISRCAPAWAVARLADGIGSRTTV